MKCLRCNNSDAALFFARDGKTYCRACLDFGPLEAGVPPQAVRLKQRVIRTKPVLEFELTPFQKRISEQALSILKSGRDVFVYAAAGAGKTEISLGPICHYLGLGKKVCFAISRRQVVLEIAARLAKNFPDLSVIAVCQGHTRVLDADLIVCTTHQLYRYPDSFDLLILDELDAFPFAGNAVLEALAEKSCRGQRLLLSATPDPASFERIRQGKMEMVQLFKRPHGKPLCVPRKVYCSRLQMVLRILLVCRTMKRNGKQVLVYVPRIADGWWMALCLKGAGRSGLIHSKSQDKDAVMDAFRARELDFLICTTLLERGITVPSVQVLVYRADHRVFTEASLIQIFGRVGRTFADPSGIGICFMEARAKAVDACCAQIEAMNASAFSV